MLFVYSTTTCCVILHESDYNFKMYSALTFTPLLTRLLIIKWQVPSQWHVNKCSAHRGTIHSNGRTGRRTYYIVRRKYTWRWGAWENKARMSYKHLLLRSIFRHPLKTKKHGFTFKIRLSLMISNSIDDLQKRTGLLASLLTLPPQEFTEETFHSFFGFRLLTERAQLGYYTFIRLIMSLFYNFFSHATSKRHIVVLCAAATDYFK